MNERLNDNLFQLEPSWKVALKDELEKPYVLLLQKFIDNEYAISPSPIYPPKHLIFNAFNQTPFDNVNVLIIGQDPYHGPGQANGLCFSVSESTPLPPSLRNIYKELEADLQVPRPKNGDLLSWAKQGVMLLNATLTVSEGKPLSHHKRGWEQFTDAVVRVLFERDDPLVFVLWGKSAQDKCRFLTNNKCIKNHLILTAPHPSPLSAHHGFFGCKHFSQINAFLSQAGKPLINFSVT